MKQINTRILCGFLAAVLLFSMIPSALAYTGVDRWAEAEVAAMDELGLIPESLADANLKANISRLDMARIAVLAYEKITETEIPLPQEHPFTDSVDEDVEKAWSVGLVHGDGDGSFRPNDSLTRLEFFTIVTYFLKALGYPVSEEDYADISGFSDAGSIPNWGRDNARLTVGLGIVMGTGSALNWRAATARQEGIALFYRTYLLAVEDAPGENPPEETEPEETVPEETVPEETEPEYDGDFINLSGWAEEAVYAMDEMDLIPNVVKASPMDGAITRQNMCKILMNTYKRLMCVTDEDLSNDEHPFTDTDDVDVRNAYRLGIVNGRGDGTFGPDDPITRQDFFTMSVNFLNALGYPLRDDETVDLSQFRDAGQLSGYAKGPTRLLVGLDIVKGNTDKTLKPKSPIVCQESLAIFYRIYNFVYSWSENPDVPVDPDEPDEPDYSKGQEVVDLAMQYLGYDYVYGGKSPESGFDCSGFVYYVYKQFGYTLYPGATNQWKTLSDEIVPEDELQPGDLVFFSGNGDVSGMEHVGIYIGDGKMIHAANPSKGVIITSLSENYYKQRYLGAKRVIKD